MYQISPSRSCPARWVQRYRPAARVHGRAARPVIHLHAHPLVREDRRMQRKIIRAGRVDGDVRHARVPLDELRAVRVGERALNHAPVRAQSALRTELDRKSVV